MTLRARLTTLTQRVRAARVSTRRAVGMARTAHWSIAWAFWPLAGVLAAWTAHLEGEAFSLRYRIRNLEADLVDAHRPGRRNLYRLAVARDRGRGT